MAKRVGIVLSGCGNGDGTEIQEAVMTLLAVERNGGDALFFAPDVPQARVVDHRTYQPEEAAPPRSALAEAARIARGKIRDLASVKVGEVDAMIFPGGRGVATTLSNYEEKGVVCDVHPEVIRVLKGHLSSHRPMGFICLAPILAARVLGPVAGVRLTLGARGSAPDKHAAVMGADVRPCPVREVVVDEKARVVSTPAFMYDDARVGDVMVGIEKLVRTVLAIARGQQNQRPAGARPTIPGPRRPEQAVGPTRPAAEPVLRRRRDNGRPTPGRGSA